MFVQLELLDGFPLDADPLTHSAKWWFGVYFHAHFRFRATWRVTLRRVVHMIILCNILISNLYISLLSIKYLNFDLGRPLSVVFATLSNAVIMVVGMLVVMMMVVFVGFLCQEVTGWCEGLPGWLLIEAMHPGWTNICHRLWSHPLLLIKVQIIVRLT